MTCFMIIARGRIYSEWDNAIRLIPRMLSAVYYTQTGSTSPALLSHRAYSAKSSL